MRLIRVSAVLVIGMAVLVQAVVKAADTNTYFAENSPDWIYQRTLDLYGYLLKASVSEPERALHRRKAYEFYFEYWARHHLPKAAHAPVPPFEQRFSGLIRREVLPFVPADDPLNIRELYVQGKLKKVSFSIPQIKDEELMNWSGYQKIVGDFRRFVGEPETKKQGSKK